MPEWVFQLPVAVSPELVRERHLYLCASRRSLGKERIRVLHLKVQNNGCSSQGVRSSPLSARILRKFVTKHHRRAVYQKCGVHDSLLIRSQMARQLSSAKGVLVEVDSGRSVRDHQ